MNIKKGKTKIIASIMSVIMALSMILTPCVTVSAAVTGFRDQITDGVNTVGYFEVDGNVAVCINHSMATPGLNSPTGTPAESYNEELRKVLYYGSYGPAAILGTTDADWIITSLAASRANGDTAGTNAATSFMNSIAALPPAPSNFHVWVVDTNGGATQQLAYWSIDQTGWANLVKTSANPSITDGNSCYSLAGAVYGVYTDWNCTNQVGAFTTDEWGNSNTIELNADNYYVKEISAPMGYTLDNTIYEVVVTSGQTATVYVTDIPQSDPVSILLQKVDAETGLAVPQGDTSLANAEFTIKYFSGLYDTNLEDQGVPATRTWVLKTDQDGFSVLNNNYKVSGDELFLNLDNQPTFPIGTITIQETKAPEGYLINPEIFVMQITSDSTNQFIQTYNAPIIPETAIHGGVKLQKRDYETTGNTPQGGATLAGTVIEITNTSANPVMVEGTLYNPGQVVKTVTTGADGTATVAADVLPYGSYSYTEVTPPTGYLSEGILSGTFDIVENGVIVDLTAANTSIQNNVIRGGVKLQKRDYETTFGVPQGNATLGGAVFEIINISANPVLVEGTLYNPGQVVKTVTTGLDGSVTVAADVLPYGSYRVNELTAPNGYLQEGITSRTFDIRENGVIVDLTDVNTSILNQIKRGDLELIKIEDGTNYRMSNIPFRITSKTTGENHVIVTDENGYASTHASWNSHLQNTNRGQTSTDGIWFGTSQPDDSKGALPYDTYLLDELPCANNEGKHLLTGIEITISRDNHTVNLGTLTNDSIPQEEIVRTTAKDAATGGHNGEVAETVTIIDTVEYANLTVGKEYTLRGILMDKATGSPLLVNGQQITSEVTFTPTTANGTVDVSFTFHGSALWGKEVVVFESLYRDGIEIYTHADINDPGQTVTFPEQPKVPNKPETPPATPKTGDHPWITPVFTGVFFVSAGCIFGIAVYRKKKQHE